MMGEGGDIVDINEDVIRLGANLASYIGRNSVQSIRDKVKAVKISGNKDNTIDQMEEIIHELIQEKSELITLAQAYDEQLMMRKISSGDIEYITETIVPLIEHLLIESDGEDAEKLKKNMDIITPILSKETFNILQLLGFNFKQAIGEPLTQLIRDAINSQSPVQSEKTLEFSVENEKRVTEYFKILQNEEAYERLMEGNK